MKVTVRPYNDTDFHAVLQVWEESMFLDAPTPAGFVRRVLLDENRTPESLLVAEVEGRVVGFALCLVLRHPIERTGLLEQRGFITAFGVASEFRRQGVATALFDIAEEWFGRLGRSEITVAPYVPNYFIPGVDKAHYADAIQFLESRNYREFADAIGMDALIGQFQLTPELEKKERQLAEAGIQIGPLRREQLVAFLCFMEEVMPGDWVQAVRAQLERTADAAEVFETVQVAIDSDKIIGYCQFHGEHFGPFGVADSHQSKGIGSVLLARTLLQMRKSGHHSAYVLWTGERAAHGIYGKLGFNVTRRFALMRKAL